MKDSTKVVFRVWLSDGDVIALFPEIPADNDGKLCQSFQHVGQHGGTDTAIVRERTRPAQFIRAGHKGDAKAVAELSRELRERGYKLDVRHRCTAKMRAVRQGRCPACGYLSAICACVRMDDNG
jgi:hypothetical protein